MYSHLYRVTGFASKEERVNGCEGEGDQMGSTDRIIIRMSVQLRKINIPSVYSQSAGAEGLG